MFNSQLMASGTKYPQVTYHNATRNSRYEMVHSKEPSKGQIYSLGQVPYTTPHEIEKWNVYRMTSLVKV